MTTDGDKAAYLWLVAWQYGFDGKKLPPVLRDKNWCVSGFQVGSRLRSESFEKATEEARAIGVSIDQGGEQQ